MIWSVDMRFVDNIKNSYVGNEEELDRADIIQWIIITAVVVGLALFVFSQVSPAVQEKGTQLGEDITNADTSIRPAG